MATHKIFVGNLSWETDEKELEAAFSAFGTCSECAVIRDAKTNKSRGFGFVTFGGPEAADKAIRAMDGQLLGGRKIRVKLAKEKGNAATETKADTSSTDPSAASPHALPLTDDNLW